MNVLLTEELNPLKHRTYKYAGNINLTLVLYTNVMLLELILKI